MITALDETRRAPEPGGLALDHRLARQYLGAGKARGERLDHYGLQQAGGLAVLTGFAGGFVCHPIRQVSVIAAGSVGHRVALMITAMMLLPWLDVVAKTLGEQGMPNMQIVWARMAFGALLTLNQHLDAAIGKFEQLQNGMLNGYIQSCCRLVGDK